MKPLYSFTHKNLVFETYNIKPHFKGLELVELNQVHGTLIVGPEDTGASADGFQFQEQDLSQYIPAIRTADCLPIWIQSNSTNYLLHAGWRGLHQNIMKAIPSIDFGLIGPSIQPHNFEVQDDFRQYFTGNDFFHKTSEKLTFNLQAYAKKLMKDISIDLNEIIDSKTCTFESPQLHSYRLDKTIKRNWSIIRSLS